MAVIRDMMPAFELFQPASIDEALSLLDQHKSDAWVMGGGMDSFDWLKDRTKRPGVVVDLSQVAELRGIKEVNGGLEIGATTTHAEIAASPLVRKSCPILSEAASQIGDIQVRNRGTIGGSIAHADPAADLPTVLVALGATVVAKGPKGVRKIRAENFFVDLFTTALKAGEIVTSVVVPSYRNAIVGCTATARRVGIKHAMIATSSSRAEIPA